MGELPPGFEPRREDKLFGQIAVSRHFVAPHHVREAMEELAKRSKTEKDLRLADILGKRGYITRGQLETIQSFTKKQMGPDRVGRYDLIDKIGEGGMGTVYKAKDTATGRLVALKVLPAKLAEDKVFMGRFQREAIAVTRLDHPNIVRGLDVGSADDSHYIAMEFIDGIDCDKMLARRGRIPEKEAASIALQVAKALQYAGEKRLVHRDIKPANILVMKDGTAKLTDLGLAKSTSATAAKLTQTGITMGTPHYISPEQAMGSSDLDVRSDIYSLGATLYQLVTGRVPFEGSSPAIIVAKHLTEELPNPRDTVPELSDGLLLVLEKMLAKKREDRYADAADLVTDLESVVEGKPPSTTGLDAGRSTMMKAAQFREIAERLAKKRRDRVRSRRGPVMLIVGIALGLGIAVGVAVILLRSRSEVLDQIKNAAQGVVERLGSGHGPDDTEGWTSLVDGKSTSGWQSFGPRGWAAGAGYIESSDPGGGHIETARTFKDFQLRAEVAASKGSHAWLVLGKAREAPMGGQRLALPAGGEDDWVRIDARVKGTGIEVLADGRRISARPGVMASEGVIAFEAARGILRFRNVRIRRLQPEGKMPQTK